jgi:hypothetical protein
MAMPPLDDDGGGGGAKPGAGSMFILHLHLAAAHILNSRNFKGSIDNGYMRITAACTAAFSFLCIYRSIDRCAEPVYGLTWIRCCRCK